MSGRDFWKNRRWGLERVFVLLFILWGIFSLTRAPGWTTTLTGLALLPIGAILGFRYLRSGIRRIIWRLRNRLIVTYIFIGLVPVFLIVVLVALGSYILFGQVADYLIKTELDRRADSLSIAAETLATAPADVLPERIEEIGRRSATRFPHMEILVIRGEKRICYPGTSKLEAPPKAWHDYAGLAERDGSQFEIAHLRRNGVEVTLLAPLTSDTLSTMVPGMADVQFLNLHLGEGRIKPQNPNPNFHLGHHLPPSAGHLDFEVYWLGSPRLPQWSNPDAPHTGFLSITTRPSAVVDVLFGNGVGTEQWSLFAFVTVAIIFLVVEIGSIIIGLSLTRTITGAVHELYEGTERVTAGDFSHRIAVNGSDQLAELGSAFNSMTENLARLIVVAKEKERLESEIEIARGVQNQLFPKAAPAMKTIQLSGSCSPARMVSGDYYDFLSLANGNVAIAIGDVAGKGIAAALLMASIQSIMRTQLTSGVPTGGNGNPRVPTGTVSQMVGQLNRQLYASTSAEKYATFCFGLYDEERTTLTYTNAGHLPPILLHAGEPLLLEVTGTVVGAFPRTQYEECSIIMGPGDILVAYTDGIVEPENVYGEEFGTSRMMDLVMKYQSEASDEIIARIMEAVPHWTESSELSDDMTVVLARRLK